MTIDLNEAEIRVLGALIEKELSTPDYYPLSLNALINACNQKSARDPVVAYDPDTVLEAVDGLIGKGLVWQSDVSRVPKFEERFTPDRSMVAREAAVLCVLLLRGPQTPGNIRGRTTRLHRFADLNEVAETLEALEEWGLVRCLPRQPGTKESRYTHLLGGTVEAAGETTASISGVANEPPAPLLGAEEVDRIQQLETDLAGLREDFEALKGQFLEFKRQFE